MPVPDIWTIGRLRDWTRDYLTKYGSATARLDGDLLLGEVLKLGRLELLLRTDQPVEAGELAAFKALVKRRAAHEPVAYILGRRAFHALELDVDARVLVPRPETESLVDLVLRFLKQPDAPEGGVLDLCTGSGAIALAIQHGLPKAETGATLRPVLGTDVSPEALAVASKNGQKLGLDVTWSLGDLWAAVPEGAQFAAIVSNPPYVLHDVIPTLAPDVRVFEPLLALDGGTDGLDQLRVIAAHGVRHLVPGGLLAVELGSPAQGRAFAELLDAAGLPGARVELVLEGPTSLVSVRAPV